MDKALESSPLSENSKQNIRQWLKDEKYSHYLQELEGLIENQEWHLLEDNFFRVLPFGTGGRRGTCGIGSNRVNRVTIGETVQALCDYMRGLYGKKELRVGIAYDSRTTSQEFAEYCANVLSGNGIKSFIFDGPRSTPELSFTVRDMSLDAGIVITASHNPSSDNGIKLYWKDGGQLVPPHDSEILKIAASVEFIKESETQIEEDPLVSILGTEQDERYWQAAQNCITEVKSDLKIAYSPLHGTGITSTYPVLVRSGFDVRLYEPQSNMDGHFPNVTNNIPNPEMPEANDRLSEFSLEQDCDIATSNDPDADRFCVLVNHNGKMVQLNGNQSAVLLTDYVLERLKDKGELTEKHFISSTIVTSDMLLALANFYGVKAYSNLLVGFKYIGEQILIHHDGGDEIFVCGGEESYGGVVGDYCRDKDAAGPTAVIAELAAKLKSEDKTLIDKLEELYLRHGFYWEDLYSIGFPGAEGFSMMVNFMDKLRNQTPKEIAGFKVVRVRDYLDGKEIEGRKENVFRIELSEDGTTRVTVRPSGTEPKIKIYTQYFAPVDGNVEVIRGRALANVDLIKKSIVKMIDELKGVNG
ncbi:MAG: phospho-sugar mutase [Candidatus Saccharibacteria bacterium]|nr:phospho-sugar mutase [Candidatus Saccharibacteria bacterium]